ncbi:MAG TPA: hypothetical protein VK206_28110, partial [Anaerolineales bacterium]|nr:hypothetical protein [Anaerolineales bacterium]
LYWTIMLTPLFQAFGVGRGLFHWQSGVTSEPWQVILTVILNLAIAIFFLLGIPKIVPFTVSSLRALYPELGYGLLTGGVLGIGWSVIYPVLNWLL